MKNYLPKIILFILIVSLFGVVKSYGLTGYLTLEYLKENQTGFQEFYLSNKIQTLSFYALVYIFTTALSIPGATVLTLAGGAFFGFGTGLLVISFASTIGATIAFLTARFFFREKIQDKFGDKLKTFNRGIEKEGAYYLLSLRLLPVFPFFLINLLMGLTKIKTSVFFFVSQLGMLLGTMVYVNAGCQLSKINNLSEIFSPRLIISFSLLGILPLLTKLWLARKKTS